MEEQQPSLAVGLAVGAQLARPQLEVVVDAAVDQVFIKKHIEGACLLAGLTVGLTVGNLKSLTVGKAGTFFRKWVNYFWLIILAYQLQKTIISTHSYL